MKRLIGLVLATIIQKKIVPMLFNFHNVEIGAILTTIMEEKIKVRIDARTSKPRSQHFREMEVGATPDPAEELSHYRGIV
jgi:hypothetical protein